MTIYDKVEVPFVYLLKRLESKGYLIGFKKEEIDLMDLAQYQDKIITIKSSKLKEENFESGFKYVLKITDDIMRKFDDMPLKEHEYHLSKEEGSVSEIKLNCKDSQDVSFCQDVLA